jgi:hypothetical protein
MLARTLILLGALALTFATPAALAQLLSPPAGNTANAPMGTSSANNAGVAPGTTNCPGNSSIGAAGSTTSAGAAAVIATPPIPNPGPGTSAIQQPCPPGAGMYGASGVTPGIGSASATSPGVLGPARTSPGVLGSPPSGPATGTTGTTGSMCPPGTIGYPC